MSDIQYYEHTALLFRADALTHRSRGCEEYAVEAENMVEYCQRQIARLQKRAVNTTPERDFRANWKELEAL